jgi:hypothetical protein
LRAGAFDYVSKPVDIAQVRDVVGRALARRARAGQMPPEPSGDALPGPVRQPGPSAGRDRSVSLEAPLFAGLPTLDELEKRYLRHVLADVKGNRTHAAEVLGVDRRTLYRMAERFGIDLDSEPSIHGFSAAPPSSSSWTTLSWPSWRRTSTRRATVRARRSSAPASLAASCMWCSKERSRPSSSTRIWRRSPWRSSGQVRCLEIDREDLERLFAKQPHAALDILTVLSRRIRRTDLLLGQRVARNANEAIEAKTTLGEHVADGVTRFGGSWRFIFAFAAILLSWILANSVGFAARAPLSGSCAGY